jgi:hypothetical protein
MDAGLVIAFPDHMTASCFQSYVDHPSQKLPFSENQVTELEPEELARLYVKYTMLALLQGDAMRFERNSVREMYEPVTTEFQDIINPTTPEWIQSELDENSTRCKMEPKSFGE